MLVKNAVSSEMLNILKILQNNKLFENHILAGGTALAFQIGHRTSTDIDLFTFERQDSAIITEYFIKQFINCNITFASDEFIQIFVNNVKIELVHHDYKIVKSPISEENIKIFDKVEIAAMKLKAIQGRTKARDFIDLAYLLQEMPLKNMFEIYKDKYGNISEKMIKRTILTKCKTIKDNDWLVGIKMLRNDIKPEDVLNSIEKGIEDYNNSINVGSIY
ncbi:MAG: nucleotidyl transferase AbiEii/AbiGii toxin family protein [Treponema sp.]|nr:nucleotidyl transferase AbiEii/AbiGii toxin family protein [Treponema sp.]